jgi:outer membrane protein OmpA-like peptidoglycan-associated protein
MKKIFFILDLLLLVHTSYSQKRIDLKDHAFSRTMVITLEGGVTYGLTDYKDFILDYAGKAEIEYFFPTASAASFGLRAFGGGGYLSGKDKTVTIAPQDTRWPYSYAHEKFRTDLIFAGVGPVLMVSLGDVVFPYLFGGVSYLHFNPKDDFKSPLPNSFKYKKDVLNFNAEFGLRFLLSKNLSLNLSVASFINTNDNLDDDYSTNVKTNDIYFTGMTGLSFSFFNFSDIDDDGFYDDEDVCIDEPEDYDGYEDDDGCPDLDNDGDKINDVNDKCDNLPEDFDGYYDEDGCPDLDNDGDGILDNDDKCPNEEEDFDNFLDDDGCPDVDNDGDGILDRFDKCPNEPETKNNFEDEDGCYDEKPQPVIKVEAPKEIILKAGTTFEIGKAELNPSSYYELDKIVEVMKEHPDSRWRIEGHTDNTGSAKKNKQLSLERANAVAFYFINNGISRSRLEVLGLGKDYPVADNKTAEGKALNRRVVILRKNQ